MTDSDYKHWKLDTDSDGILWCTLDYAEGSTNILSASVMEEFSQLLDFIESTAPAGVVFASAKTSGFIAGADVNSFATIQNQNEALDIINNVHGLFNRLDSLPCPTLAMINGFCLGGGLELSLACDYRVAVDDPKTRIGLPEVMLGIFPGFGGTVRLIRVMGAIPAMQLMLAGRTLDARKAAKSGMIDRAVPERQLRRAAAGMISRKSPPRVASAMHRLASATPCRQAVSWFLIRELNKKINVKHYPAPYKLVELWKDHGDNETQMLQQEALAVSNLIVSDTARNLVRVFQLQERMKASGSDAEFEPRHVHVIGAGVMGGDIAAWCAYKGYTVTLQDREAKFIAPAIARAHKYFKRRLRVTNRVTAARDRLIPDLNGLGIERADVIIEAIIENADAKIELFKDLESRAKPEAILATNTSSIPLDEISRHMTNADRLVGIHFFNPVSKMQLVEIVHDNNTAKIWITRASTFCRKISRLPLPVKSSPGFLVNRILTPYLLEAVALLEEGYSAAQIDKQAEQFGMPMGPVELADTVGLDICLSVAENLSHTIPVNIPEKLKQLVKRGDLGKKTGAGFYHYKKGKAQKNAEQGSSQAELSVDRLVYRILNECPACLREGIVEDADLLDAGMIFGTGFAPFRGGPMQYAKTLGIEKVKERFNELASGYGDRYQADDAWDTISND